MSYADTTTNRLRLTVPTVGSTSWAPKINSDLSIIDSTVAALGQTNVFTTSNTFNSAVLFPNLTANTCLKLNTNGVVSSVSCGGGSGGSSTLAVNQNGIQITSPTVAINALSPPFLVTAVGASTTAQWALDGSSVTLRGTNVINLQGSLQTGSTFFVSSGTVNNLVSGTHKVKGGASLSLYSTADTGVATMANLSSASSQVTISATNGIGINVNPSITGVDLQVPTMFVTSQTISGTFITTGTVRMKSPISVNQPTAGVQTSQINFTNGSSDNTAFVGNRWYSGTGFSFPLMLSNTLNADGTYFSNLFVDPTYGVTVHSSTNSTRSFSVGTSMSGTYDFAVTTTGVTVPQIFQTKSATLSTLATSTPTLTGVSFYCSDCTVDTICTSTQTVKFGYASGAVRTAICH